MYKIIFFDIDGVLNSNFGNDNHQKEISDGKLIDIEKIRLLSKLIENTNARSFCIPVGDSGLIEN